MANLQHLLSVDIFSVMTLDVASDWQLCELLILSVS